MQALLLGTGCRLVHKHPRLAMQGRLPYKLPVKRAGSGA